MFGGEYSRATYSDLWAWVQTQTGYLKTEAQWQALSTANAGNVPYYSDGDGSTTFRVPSLKCWVKGANGTVSEVGSYLAAGLPNITGSFDLLYANSNISIIRATAGAFSSPASAVYENSSSLQTGSSLTDRRFHQPLDASKSNAIYGNSTTVQPPSIVGMWLVKAYGVVEDTGQIDEQQYLDDRMADLKNVYLPANYLPLSGGTMTGEIKAPASGILATNSITDKYTVICGGTDMSSGARIGLRGKDYSDAGSFVVVAHNGTTEKAITGRPDGTLTWDGKLLSAPSGRILTASGTVAKVTSTFTKIASVTANVNISNRWLVIGHTETSIGLTGVIITQQIENASNSNARYDGTGGGGAVSASVVTISSNTTFTLRGYSNNTSTFNFIGQIYAIPLM